MEESSEKVVERLPTNRVIVDLTEAEQAFGENTTYYAGRVKVAGDWAVIDGCTDRDDGWIGVVVDMLRKYLDAPGEIWVGNEEDGNVDMQVNDEMSLGGTYEVSVDGDRLKIVDVTPKDPRFELLEELVAGFSDQPDLLDDNPIFVRMKMGDWRRAKKILEGE